MLGQRLRRRTSIKPASGQSSARMAGFMWRHDPVGPAGSRPNATTCHGDCNKKMASVRCRLPLPYPTPADRRYRVPGHGGRAVTPGLHAPSTSPMAGTARSVSQVHIKTNSSNSLLEDQAVTALHSVLLLDQSPLPANTGIHSMLFQCWPIVFDAGPTLKQHWVKAPCLLGSRSVTTPLPCCTCWLEKYRRFLHFFFAFTHLLSPRCIAVRRLEVKSSGQDFFFNNICLKYSVTELIQQHLKNDTAHAIVFDDQ